jgi:hypothetical protein
MCAQFGIELGCQYVQYYFDAGMCGSEDEDGVPSILIMAFVPAHSADLAGFRNNAVERFPYILLYIRITRAVGNDIEREHRNM